MLNGFEDFYAEVNGTRLHYVSGGEGKLVVLLPGWPRTWWQFRKLMPDLAERYRVVAVDLRGMGQSDKPQTGYDKKNMAEDIYQLVRSLGYEKAYVCGEDIGGMVAFSYAANHPEATDKLALWETISPNEGLYEIPMLPRAGEEFVQFWLSLNMIKELPEKILSGRFRAVSDWIIDHYAGGDPDAYTELDRATYAAAYDTPDAIRAGNAWYQAWHQDMVDDKQYSKLTMPVLFLAGKSAPLIIPMIESRTTDLRAVEVSGGGHFLAEERPQEILSALAEFLD
ncbi:alpha/beta fold hydrolase [Streptomyces sp. NPDC051217]|uniref:alpha/beta fold hydrolase n=1 Tax=Streptomyces sp. NPDC051217 TaxID=3365644 RepID=UPI00379EF1FE